MVTLTSLQNILRSITLKRELGERDGVVRGRLAGSQSSSSLMKLQSSTHWSSARWVQQLDLAHTYPDMKDEFLAGRCLIIKHIGG